MHRTRRLSSFWFIALLLLFSSTSSRGSNQETNISLDEPDIFAELISDTGLTGNELGFRPNTTWPRFPHNPPGKMPFFDDLWGDMRSVYPFARTLGNTVEDLLNPALLENPREGEPGTLYRLAVSLGYDRRIGGIRGVGAKLYEPKPTAKEPLVNALIDLTRATGVLRARRSLQNEVRKIPSQLHVPLTKLVIQMITARTWIDLGLRNVPQPLQAAIWEQMPKILELITDEECFIPELDDAQKLIDEHSLAYGTLIALEALQRARADIAGIEPPPGGFTPFVVRLATPWGTILIDNHSEQQKPINDPFLVVRVYPQGATKGPIGATSPGHPLSATLLIEADGNVNAEKDQRIASNILGSGLVLATGSHDNQWNAGRYSLGAGLLGTGILWDGSGNDIYRSVFFSQGSGAHFAVAALIDENGDDDYALTDFAHFGIGRQGGAGLGFGWDTTNAFFIDRAGNDCYEANMMAMGCAHERSHAWFIDERGNDHYQLDDTTLGFGVIDQLPKYAQPRQTIHAFALPQTGLFFDLEGTDIYERWKQGGLIPDERASDERFWKTDGERSPGAGINIARGSDTASGRIGWLDAWPRHKAL